MPSGLGGYDEFAPLYERRWGETSLHFLAAYDRLIFDALPLGSRILDLACGTGQLAARLSERGYQVTGVDSAGQMLAFAEARAPKAEFILADARTFDIGRRFDAVISVYDSLNHVLTLDELGAVFRRVRAALIRGGRFAFDLVTEEALAPEWHDCFVDHDQVAIAASVYDPETRTLRFDATLFLPGGEGWTRSDIHLVERCYTETEVRRALEAAGFAGAEVVPAENFKLRPGRLFYAATTDV